MQTILTNACVVMVAAGVTTFAHADTAMIAPGRSNTLYETVDGSLSNGAGDYLFAGLTGASEKRRGLLYFDIAAAIPSGSIIQSVSLHMHMTRASDSSVYSIGLHRALADWGAGTSDASGHEGGGAPSTPNDATWLHNFYSTSFWSNVGGDFDASASAAANVGEIGPYSWNSAQMALDAQAWLDSPVANFGWFIIGNESTASSAKRFNTEEYFDSSFHPVLEVTYQVPAPGAASILALCAACSSPRRSRR